MSRLYCFFGLFCWGLSLSVSAQQKYELRYVFTGKDTSFTAESTGLQTSFAGKEPCTRYINEVVPLLQSKGYITASVDSVWYDSAYATAWIYAGKRYQWVEINTDSADKKALSAAGWSEKAFRAAPVDFKKLGYWQERLLEYFENNGHPFAQVRLDSLTIEDDKVHAKLVTIKGPAYKIDSIRVYGKARISNYFLQQYLGIADGSSYKKSKLQTVSRRLLELPYLKETQPWDISMLGTGSILNLYLDPKKSSQADVILGFLPATGEPGRTKMQLTGEANINLKNALGTGETIGVNWQQIQVKSPRLHLLYEQPYIFKTPFGIDFNFDLLKKDSSFLNLNAQFGVQYFSSARQTAKVFIQTFFTNVLPAGVDTAVIKVTRRLPSFVDVSTTNLGLNYRYISTDYRFNPRRGFDFDVTTAAGLRRIRQNNAIMGLTKDAGGNDFDFSSLYDTIRLRTYVMRLNVAGAYYISTGKQSVVKTAVTGGWIYSPEVFRNEMFQIGGYKLLRGFDEESIFANAYGVITAEYRYFMGLNSYFFGFVDGARVSSKSYQSTGRAGNYLGFGAGMAFETRAGIFNLSYAVGKREDIPLNFRQAKIHFGLVSLF
ncbi:MAG: hypothetical protein KIT80_03650 [Chitinophagaceae bacterium]|nr:hypothetical protein [Chitinophagaceae bacterium]MCW5925982.1 hypothetical protein [Chitinophagaceae bacterium]